MRRLTYLVALALCACSEKKLEQVHARYEPPNGFELVREEPGPPPRAVFRPGLVIARVAAKDVQTSDLKAAEAKLLAASGVTARCELQSSRDGTLPVGPVTRMAFECSDGTRALTYLAPNGDTALVVTLNAPEASYGVLEAKVERSLSSLKSTP